jgi:hypothetical protein
MLLLLFALLQQLEHVTGLGDFREVELGFDLRLASLFFRRRYGLGRKMLADFFGFIVLNRARVSFFLGDAETF